jgi:hypothetical protein
VLNTNTSFKLITRDIERSLDRVERDPAVKREAEYYLKNISKVKSVKDFLADDRLFRFAMKAHGLSNMTYAKAFMKKALEEGIDSSQSFANKLADTRYRDFVETFNFARHGETATIFTRAQAARWTATCGRCWRRTPAGTTKACGSRSISSARPPRSTISTRSWPTRPCRAWSGRP